MTTCRGELSYLAPLGSEKISAPYFKQCFFRGGGSITPQAESNRILVIGYTDKLQNTKIGSDSPEF